MSRSVFNHRRGAAGLLAFDSFTGSDTADFDGRLTEVGGYSWLNTAGDSGTIGIKSNTCYASDNSNAPWTTAVVNVPSADVEITVTVVDLHASAGAAGIAFRYADTDDDDGWTFKMVGTGAVAVRKAAAGVFTTPHSDTVTYTPGDTLTVRCIGTAIECFHNAASIFSFTDSHDSASTRHGVAFLGTNNDAHHLDDFTLYGI